MVYIIQNKDRILYIMFPAKEDGSIVAVTERCHYNGTLTYA